MVDDAIGGLELVVIGVVVLTVGAQWGWSRIRRSAGWKQRQEQRQARRWARRSARRRPALRFLHRHGLLLDEVIRVVEGSSTPIALTPDGANWPSWRVRLGDVDLYSLVIGGCDTCAWWFERLGADGDLDQAERLAVNLGDGITALTRQVVDQASQMIPDGHYRVILMDLIIRLVEPGDPHDYFVDEQVATWGRDDSGWVGEVDPSEWRPYDPEGPYYRAAPLPPYAGSEAAFNFLLPLQPPALLDAAVVDSYAARMRRGERPTVLAVAVSDSRNPWDGARDGGFDVHHILAHIVLDGHHKLHAAALTDVPIRVMSFVVA